MKCELQDKVFTVSAAGFESLALEVFQFQYANNQLYRVFADTLKIDPSLVRSLSAIPFLPVSFFKNHEVTTGLFQPEYIFESSGTTNTGNSRHFIKALNIYKESFTRAFELFYGPVNEWCILGLLPSYLERQNSSLVMMVDELIKESQHSLSGFYLYEHHQLAELITENEKRGQKTLLIGVTFALIDLAEKFNFPLKYTVVMETGGMKGRRKEITRKEVHSILKNAWQLEQVHSEYGMSELLSQAYSKNDGIFECPPWMKIILREEDDPVTIKSGNIEPLEGLVNVIDLANIYSCSFIATDDMGKLYRNGSFEITGRMDISDVRGCSLMYT